MRKHPFDFVSFVFGLMFVGLVAFVLLDRYTEVNLDLRFALPVAFVLLGVLGLIGSVVGQRRADRRAAVALDD